MKRKENELLEDDKIEKKIKGKDSEKGKLLFLLSFNNSSQLYYNYDNQRHGLFEVKDNYY